MNLVFTDALGGHYAHNTVSHNFKRALAAIGLPDRRFHDLRHTYAVLAIQSGVDIKTVQENLGHHTAAFTVDVYGHVTERMQKEAAARMEATITARKGKKHPETALFQPIVVKTVVKALLSGIEKGQESDDSKPFLVAGAEGLEPSTKVLEHLPSF